MADIRTRFMEAYAYLLKEGLVAGYKDFASKISVSTSMITEISKERSNVGMTAIQNTVLLFPINADWLLTGRGSMLLDSKNPEESKLGCTPIATPISPAEESIIYKMYKDEKEDWKAEKEKKEAQIDHLQSELRSMEKELATLKATHPQTSPPGVVIEEIHEVLGSPRIAKHADTKPHSSTCAPSAGSVQPHQENQ